MIYEEFIWVFNLTSRPRLSTYFSHRQQIITMRRSTQPSTNQHHFEGWALLSRVSLNQTPCIFSTWLAVVVLTSPMSFKASRDDSCKQIFRIRPVPSATKGFDRICSSKLIRIRVTVPPAAATSFSTSSHSCRITSTRWPTPISSITSRPPAFSSRSIPSSHLW